MSKRTFVPIKPSPYPTPAGMFCRASDSTIDHWEWTRRGGLQVVYRDGIKTKSWWGSLPEFIKAIQEGREVPVVESGPDSPSIYHRKVR